jgi:hypothetical protein
MRVLSESNMGKEPAVRPDDRSGTCAPVYNTAQGRPYRRGARRPPMPFPLTTVGRIALVLLLASPAPCLAQAATLGTIGAGVAGETSASAKPWTPPAGPAPRTAAGRPDMSGVWDHAYVPDMSESNARNPALQTGAGALPYSPAGAASVAAYDPERNGDYTGMCMPFGLMRSMNAPYPLQIMQNDKYVAFLFEQSTWFHVVPFRDRHAAAAAENPTWFGDSIARWDGDTLVVDTIGFNGYTRLDTRGNPHSDKLHMVQTFRRTDAGHLAYAVTIDDPVNYSRPWGNERTLSLSNGDLIEYSCEENNKALWDGRIKRWFPPNVHPPRDDSRPTP